MDLTLDNQKWLICHKTKPNEEHVLYIKMKLVLCGSHRYFST